MTGKRKTVANKQYVTADEIFGFGRKVSELEVPEWEKNGKPVVVHLRELSTRDVLAFTDAGKDEGSDQTEEMNEMIANSVVTPDGDPMFTEEQVKSLQDGVSLRAYQRLQKGVLELNGLSIVKGEEGNAPGEA